MATTRKANHRIEDLTVHEVSLVDHPANERPFFFRKRAAQGSATVDPQLLEALTTVSFRKALTAIAQAGAAAPEHAETHKDNLAKTLRLVAKDLEGMADELSPASDGDTPPAEGQATETATDADGATEQADDAAATKTPEGGAAEGAEEDDLDKRIAAAVARELAKSTKATPAKVPAAKVTKAAPPRSLGLSSDGSPSTKQFAWPRDLADDPPAAT